MKISKFGPQIMWKAILAFFTLVLIVCIGGFVVTSSWADYINKMMGISTYELVTSDTSVTTLHYESDFDTYTDVLNNARSVAKEVQAEGTVLMRNKNNTLPLKKEDGSKPKVTFFSFSSYDPAYGGTGSGGVSTSKDRLMDVPTACKDKLDYNPTMYKFYEDRFKVEEKKDGSMLVEPAGFAPFSGEPTPAMLLRDYTKDGVNYYNIPEIGSNEFTDDVKNSFANYSDAAIFMLSRVGGEGQDLTTTDATGLSKDGTFNYLELSAEEKSVLQTMKDGNFGARIVLVNTFNAIELDWLDEYNIDAVLYIGGPGEMGLDAVTDILVGKTNPSGKLADTYATNAYSAPAMQNFGNYKFSNADKITNKDSQTYVIYQEGIYVGYRYYETRYYDSVMGNGNATSTKGSTDGGAWNYKDEVAFSFGHGLSYTTFEQSITLKSIDFAGEKATFDVTVTNNGDMAGKDVIELYAKAPYQAGDVEKSAIQLVGFAKTELLQPKDSKTYTIEVDLMDLASYDSETAKTYIMDSGDYYFAIGNGTHDALNNILAAEGKTTADGMDYNGVAAKAVKANNSADLKYDTSVTGYEITNQFDNVDYRYYDDSFVYLSRSNWDSTWPTSQSSIAATEKMIADIASLYDANNNPSAYTPGSADDLSKYTFGSTATNYTIASMMGLDYDDPKWDDLLNQITLDEMINFSKQGRPAIESIAMPATTAVDGPGAWTKSQYKEDWKDFSTSAKKTDEGMVQYPTETVVAGTWNTELVEKLGDSFGEEGLWGGGVGWYGPAANLHRTPYAGRNFEYYSEDGFISGALAEAEVHGAMAKGVIPYLKHFFLNDQETNRSGICTFATEQSIREIYLRAFEDAFETTGEDDPSCSGVMGGFNRLGVTWTGHYSNLWKNVMEGEWGFFGNVTTDFGKSPQTLMDPRLAYEAGTMMYCTSSDTTFVPIITEKAKTDSKLVANLREATKRILYNFANSAAMNGMNYSTRIYYVMPWYHVLMVTFIVISGVVMAGCIAMLTIQTIAKRKEVQA